MPSRVPIVYGAMTFGNEGSSGRRVQSDEEAQAILDVLKKHGLKELDTSIFYTQGTSEKTLGRLGAAGQGFKIATKVYPTGAPTAMVKPPPGTKTYVHTADSIREAITTSLESLGVDSVYLYYLHGPDRSIPWAETFAATDALHKQGKFTQLGLSNYKASEVKEIMELCDTKGWVKPSVYQAPLNPLNLTIEKELVGVLRDHGASIFAFNPLLGGFLTGLKTEDAPVQEGSRFDKSTPVGKMYTGRYWNDSYFAASKKLDEASKKQGVNMATLVLRWIEHHSVLDPAKGDRVIIGASNAAQLDGNLVALEGGPLDDEVVKMVAEAWECVKEVSPPYHH